MRSLICRTLENLSESSRFIDLESIRRERRRVQVRVLQIPKALILSALRMDREQEMKRQEGEESDGKNNG